MEKVVKKKHAIIVGGSFSGMLTARVLSDFYEKVTIIEKDSSQREVFEPKDGSPQRIQIHIILPKFYDICKEYFPDFERAIMTKGSHKVDAGLAACIFIAGWKPRVITNKFVYMQSRPLLEATIEQLLKKSHANVEFLYDTEVLNILSDFKTKQLTGVRTRNLSSNSETNLYGDLIVDASGMKTNFPTMLEELDYSSPKKLEAKLEYSGMSRIFRLQNDLRIDWECMLYRSPDQKKVGYIIRIEDDERGKRWLVGLTGGFGCKFESTDQGFVDHMSDFDQEFLKIMEGATPLSPLRTLKLPFVRRYLYNECKLLPSNFIAVGDSVVNWPPQVGFGLVCSANMSKILKTLLENNPDATQLSAQYFQQVDRMINPHWNAIINDEFLPIILGQKSLKLNIRNWYKRNLLKVASKDPNVWKTVFEVFFLIDKPISTLFKPSILSKVLRESMTSNSK